MNQYEKIKAVLRIANRPLAAHEFSSVIVHMPVPGDGSPLNGRVAVGCSEATLARRLREMRAWGWVTASRREGKQFMEYALRVKAPVPAEEPPCPV